MDLAELLRRFELAFYWGIWNQDLRGSIGQVSVEKTIPFTNNDVPEYLERLRAFVEASRETVLLIQ